MAAPTDTQQPANITTEVYGKTNNLRDPNTGRLVSPYNKEEVAPRLLEALASGKTFTAARREDSSLPDQSTIYDWRRADPEFAARYYAALMAGYDHVADECLEIADRPAKDMADVQNRKLQIETRLKLLAKWSPKKYGDRIAIDGEVTVRMSPLEQLRRLEDRSANRTVIDAETGREVAPNMTGEEKAVLETIIPEVIARDFGRKEKARLKQERIDTAIAMAEEIAELRPEDTDIEETDCF
jgi:hypothetical protein